jgi:transposase
MIPTSVRVFVCTQPQDLRRGFDGLSAVVRAVLSQDPLSGAMFVFTNRRATRAKVLWWDKSGQCILYKRLHRALFRLPKQDASSDRSVVIDGPALHEFLRGVERTPKKRA